MGGGGGTVLHFLTSERTKLMAGRARRDHAVNYITPVTSFAPASRPPPPALSSLKQRPVGVVGVRVLDTVCLLVQLNV